MYSPRVVLPRPLGAAREQSERGWLFMMVLGLLFFYAAWPVFIEKKFGPLPSLTPQKVLNYLIVGMCLLQLAFDKQFTKRFFARLSAAKGLVACIVLFFAWRYVAVVFSISPFYAFKFFNYDLLTNALLFFAVVAALPERFDMAKMERAMFAAIAVITALAIAEGVAGKNLLERFQDSQTLTLALMDKIREGERRAQSVFASPLMLAQYCSVMIPFLWVAFRNRRSRLGAVAVVALMLMSLAAIYLSRTRSALGVVLLAGFFAGLFGWRRYMTDRRKNGVLRIAMGFYGSIGLLLGTLLIVWAMLGLARGLTIKQVMGLGDRGVTLYQGGSDARVTQLKMAIPKIIDSPLVGYGDNIGSFKVGFIGSDGMLTLDSLMLRQIVDAGIPSLLLQLALVACSVALAFRVARVARGDLQWREKAFGQACAACFLGMLLFMLTSPLTEMIPYYYMLMGWLVCVQARMLKDRSAPMPAT